jgi:hypothetical protein
LNCIYYRKEYKIIKADEFDYIVVNTNKLFSSGHTHMSNFNAAISVIKLVQHKELPRNHSSWFVHSLMRLSDDADYIGKLDDLLIDFRSMMESNSDTVL